MISRRRSWRRWDGSKLMIGQGLRLEVVRKGSWRLSEKAVGFPAPAFPSGSGESPAEGAEGAVAFSTCLWGWVGFTLCPLPIWEIFFGYTVSAGRQGSGAIAGHDPRLPCPRTRTPTRTRSPNFCWSSSIRILVYGNVYRFAVYVYVYVLGPTKWLRKTASMQLHSPSQYTSAPSAFSVGVLLIGPIGVFGPAQAWAGGSWRMGWD